MNIIRYPQKSEWNQLLERPTLNLSALYEKVRAILNEVKQDGDKALLKFEAQFDHVQLDSLCVKQTEMEQAAQNLPDELKNAIQSALVNIRTFHEAQRPAPIRIETAPGVVCEQHCVPIEKVGLYIPGGSAPLFSTVLMLAAPARTAGCKHIVLCTPPDSSGHINDAILYAAGLTGIDHIYKVGGAQAIAAMAYGTESITKVDKIFGPGNQFVMAAKQWVSLEDVAIDMPAGPSEVEVVADETARPDFVAADLLSQAEHGPDSQVLLVTTCADLIPQVVDEINRQAALLPRRAIAEKALQNSKLILVNNLTEAIELTNEYAPEHLIIQTRTPRDIAAQITHAGSVFLGPYSPESAGDYASGTNHTLPTKGYAKSYSGLGLDSFLRKITFQELSAKGLQQLGPTIERMAQAEQLMAHSRAVSIRLKSLSTPSAEPETNASR